MSQPRQRAKGRRKRKTKLKWGRYLTILLVVSFGAAVYMRASVINWRVSHHLRNREFHEAQAWLEWADTLAPGNPESLFLTARLHRLTAGDNFDEALRAAEAAEYDPARIEREKLLMRAQVGLFDEDEARRQLVQILQSPTLYGDEEVITEAFVTGFLRNRQFEIAKDLLKVWKQDFPNSPRPLYLLGTIEKDLKHYIEAENYFRKGLEVAPNDAVCAFDLAAVLVLRRRPGEAITFYRMAQEHGFGIVVPLARREEARCYRRLGENEQARAIVMELLKDNPDDEECVLLLSQLDSDAGDYEAVVKSLRPFVEEKSVRSATA